MNNLQKFEELKSRVEHYIKEDKEELINLDDEAFEHRTPDGFDLKVLDVICDDFRELGINLNELRQVKPELFTEESSYADVIAPEDFEYLEPFFRRMYDEILYSQAVV